MSSPPPDPAVPVQLGEFTLLGVLGEGGSATVYDARWGHRTVALKVIRTDLATAERQRFVDEARLLMEMAHPGVVKVLAAGTLPDGRAYLAMEKLPGTTLGERLGQGPVPLRQAVALFEQVCEAVAAMHAAGLLHRDLKPENVMLVDSAGTLHAVLLDFGIAKAMVDGVVTLTETGQVRGTPAYMAPERFFGSPASVATDIYELAVTLFAMVAGRLPWDDTADPDVRLNPARLGDLAEVPAALDEEVARALSTRAANRPPDVLALRERVRRAAGLGGAPAGRVTAPVELPLAATVTAAAVSTPGQPWRQLGGAATTGSASSGERVELTPPTRARRRRWPWLVAGLAVAGVAGTIGFVAARSPQVTGTRAAADPWALGASTSAGSIEPDPPGQAPPLVARLELTPARRAELRAELGAALSHHSPEASAVVGVMIAEVRASAELAPVLARAGESAALTQMRMLFVGTCELDLSARGDWLSLALIERPGALLNEWELIVRGSWTRAELEPCLGKGRPGTIARMAAPGLDGQPITAIPTDAAPQLVGWLDDHTFIATTREVDAAALAPRLRPRTTAPSAIDEIGSRIDRQASAWLLGTKAAVAKNIDTADLAADFSARLELGDDGLAAAVALYQTDRKRADKTQAAAEELLGKFKEDALLRLAIPELAIERDGATVRMRGRLPVGLLEKLGLELAAALP
ncbi:MAG: serine/threonine protein kinase [Myxococcales bacterium]|nr:serine/threonine protein kinase [Myxococcales bacterium]